MIAVGIRDNDLMGLPGPSSFSRCEPRSRAKDPSPVDRYEGVFATSWITSHRRDGGEIAVIFKGAVYRRSTAHRPRQPAVAGESEVFTCNPQRVRRILKETGWESVFYGTLNLSVAGGVFGELCSMCALFFERPEDVEHPTNQRIPEIRAGYYYYRATASVRGESQEVLVRRAGNPHDERCLELVAPVKLMDLLQIDEGSEVEVAVFSSSWQTP